MPTENKTKPTEISVESFINTVPDEQKRKDSFALVEIMKRMTGFEPKMWGPAIIGFGSYHYKYASGREGDICLVGFSPRKANLTLYLGLGDQPEIPQNLGKHKMGKGCLYINKLEDVNLDVLSGVIRQSCEHLKKKQVDYKP
jgi:hypothetical protein